MIKFITTGNSASLYQGNKPLILNMSKQDLFSLFAQTEDAIEAVEETERNEKYKKIKIDSIPAFEACNAE